MDKSERKRKFAAVRRFERAVEGLVFKGTIPYISHDPLEQRDLDEAHNRINHDYATAKANLLRQLGFEVKK